MVNTCVSPAVALDSIQRRMALHDEPVVVYWLQVAENRDIYRARMVAESCGWPLVPIVLRDDRFQSANAVMNDLSETIQHHRDEFDGAAKLLAIERRKLVIVLLSREPLSVPQISSPAQLPDWFPICPGQTVSVHIEDLSWCADGLLNAVECRVSQYL